MQTVSIPYVVADDDRTAIAEWQRLHACVVRTGYARAIADDGAALSEKNLRDLLKSRYPDHPLGSWGVHCATREALRLRRQHPDGRMVFGGRTELRRRMKGLISNEDWKLKRQSRPIEIVGDRTRGGNRHLTIASDGLSAKVGFLGRFINLRLPEMSGKTGKIIRALALLTEAGEIGVTFTLGAKSLTLTFDPMDLRKLAPGTTLEHVERAEREALGHKPRGRPRNDPETHYAAHRIRPVDTTIRPVHPEWRRSIPTMATRAVGIDLNPQWIGFTIIEIPGTADGRNLDDVQVLDHHLVRLDVPISAAPEALAAHMARAARLAVSLARKWHCATIFHEDDLGKLRWSKKSRGEPAAQTINFWSRNALLGGLSRRCTLSGLTLSPVWGGYSTTIGNISFDLPDACAAAAEIARRGIAAVRGEKDRLPAVPRTVATRRWKHGELPDTMAQAIAQAGCWQGVHRAVKAARIDARRPHPPLHVADPGPLDHAGRGYAVHRIGNGKGGRLTVAKPDRRHVA